MNDAMSDSPKTRNVLIVGMAKTGTSALYTAVQNASSMLSIYEIGNNRQIRYLAERADANRLSKMLIPKYYELQPSLSTFTHVVRVVRDPRDVVISWLLFRPFLHGNWNQQEYVDDLIGLLQRKESDPRSVAISEFRALFARHKVRWIRPDQLREWIEMDDRFAYEHPLTPTVRYEDFLVGGIDLIQHYLGLTVKTDVNLGTHNSYNQRSRASGGWKNWFTESDIEDYASIFDGYLRRYGYDTAWNIAAEPVIDPATSSEHVRRNVDKLRREPPPTGWLATDLSRYSDSYIESLRSATIDGREPAMIEYALLLRLGIGVQAQPGQSRSILEDVAARGNAIAQAHLTVDLEKGLGGSPDIERAKAMVEELVSSQPARASRNLERARALQATP